MDFERIAPTSEEVIADVFFDASFSMSGFVNQANSLYIRAIQILERSLISAWPKNSTYNYYKFGSDISQIKRNEFLKAIQPSFYWDRKFRNETRIEKVVEKAKVENLTIIITDLFQNDADVNLLISKLNDKFLKKDMSLGVLGVKSEFVGKVCDVSLQGLHFDYSTENLKPKEFRPFYVLMLGSYSDIKHFFENLKINGLSTFPEKNFIIFSPYLVERLASFEDSTLSETSKIVEVSNIITPVETRQHVKQFVVKASYKRSYFKSGITMRLLPYSIKFNSQKLFAKILAFQYHGNSFVDCRKALKAFKIEHFVLSNSNLEFETEIFPANFPENGAYCFRVEVQPEQDAYSLPDWITGWDMDQNRINRWKNNPGKFKGNTTLNLKIFLNNIWQIIYQKNKPKITKLYCYIKKA
jgi:hypothetical protein